VALYKDSEYCSGDGLNLGMPAQRRVRFSKATGEGLMVAQDGSGDVVEQDVASSNEHCVTFLIKDTKKVGQLFNLEVHLYICLLVIY